MAHYAKINQDNIVVNVIVAEPEFFETFVDDSPGTWLKTSYNTFGGVHYDPETLLPSDDQSKALRYNFAGLGFNYDKQADAFYCPKPYESWTLNTDTYLWEPPIDYPNDGSGYSWNEEEQQWDLME